MEEKIKEVYSFTHKKITIDVEIDYKANKISLIEYKDGLNGWQDKKWVFAGRGVEYMQGWLTILDAMQEAIKDAKKRYETELAERSKFLGELCDKPVFVREIIKVGKKKSAKKKK